jgi:hypothetical protein
MNWGLGGAKDISLFAVNVYDDTFEPMHVRIQLETGRSQLAADLPL